MGLASGQEAKGDPWADRRVLSRQQPQEDRHPLGGGSSPSYSQQALRVCSPDTGQPRGVTAGEPWVATPTPPLLPKPHLQGLRSTLTISDTCFWPS